MLISRNRGPPMILRKNEGTGRIRRLLALQWFWDVQLNERLLVGARVLPRSDRDGRIAAKAFIQLAAPRP